MEFIINTVKKLWENRFIRFLFIGGVNTLFGYCVYSLLIVFGLHYSISLFIATAIGVLFNFKTTGIFVFKNKDNWLIIRFIAVYAVVYCVNVLAISGLKKVGANEYTAGAIMLLPVAVLSYLLNSLFVFRKSRIENVNNC